VGVVGPIARFSVGVVGPIARFSVGVVGPIARFSVGVVGPIAECLSRCCNPKSTLLCAVPKLFSPKFKLCAKTQPSKCDQNFFITLPSKH